MIKARYGEAAELPAVSDMVAEAERMLEFTWDECQAKMRAAGYSQEKADKICGAICARHETRSTEYHQAAITPAEPGAGFAGREWEVTIIGPATSGDVVLIGGQEYIRSKNGRLYNTAGLRNSAPLFEGVKVYDNHLTDAEFKERGGMRSLDDEWLGGMVKPWWDASGRRLCANFRVVDEPLAKKLKNAHDQGLLETIGLSIDTYPIERQAVHEGRTVKLIEGFKRINSVDLVAEPAAGGGFNRLIAAQNTNQEVTAMEKDELQAMVREMVAEALAAHSQEQGTEEMPPDEAAMQVEQAAAAAAAEVAQEAPPDADPAAVAQAAADAAADAAQQAAEEVAEEVEEEQATEALKAVRRLECQLRLRDKLDAARLGPFRRVVETAFTGRIFKEGELDAFIKRVKEAQAQGDPSGRVAGAGGNGRSGVRVGLSERDVAEIEFTRLLMGNSQFRALEGIQAPYVQERITESYRGWVRAGRPNYNTRRISEWVYQLLDGDPLTDQRAFEAVTTSGMSSIVKNAMNVLLAANYARRHLWWEPLVRTEEVDTIDQATLVRVYGLNTLSVVNEGAAYTELPWRDDEETASFVKKGNYVPVTLETLLADKVQAIRTIPERLATSWYNTISALVSGVFTVNTSTGPVLGDTGALFNATAVTTAGGHANLLTAALSFTNYGAARTAMMKQTDQYSGGAAAAQGQRLLIEPRFLLVPVDLETTALQIRNSEYLPGSGNNDVNPYYQKFEVVPVPNFTDANDWALAGNPDEFPAIWLIFLRGKRVPELFTADSETQGAMFTNDTLRYKVRMMTWRFSSTYDCAPVSDWRPLHKNNVT